MDQQVATTTLFLEGDLDGNVVATVRRLLSPET
jgi:hypothetical protein